jgi:transposase
VTSSSWIISRYIKSLASRKRLKRPVRNSVYLPPYSPDLNPIEMTVSKLKALLRKTAEHTIPGLLR